MLNTGEKIQAGCKKIGTQKLQGGGAAAQSLTTNYISKK
jgi:hypothetical protein